MENNIKYGISITIIASIVTMRLIVPILNIIEKPLVTIISKVYSSMIDDLYTSAALNLTPYPSYIIFTFICALAVGLGFGVLSYSIREKIKTKSKPDIEGQLEMHKSIRKRKQVLYYLLLLLPFVSIMMFWTVSFPLKLSMNFERHMNILAPYLSENEEEIIRGKWSMMNKKDDYDNIYMELENIAKQNKIELPTSRLYSL